MQADALTERAQSSITVRRLKPRIGAEIGGVDLTRPLSDEQRDDIYAALLRHRVIFFRDQDITGEQHLAFARRFAPVHITTTPMGTTSPEIFPVKSDGKTGLAPAVWHTDQSFHAEPPMASILRARVIPSLGGDTAFSSAVAAYEGLDEATKARIEMMKAVHGAPANRGRGGYGRLHAGGGEDSDEAAARAKMEQTRFPGQEHPVVRILETGERALYVNDLITSHIVGLDPEESEALLRYLFDQFKIPENQLHFQWRVNSIAFWDNRSVQHYAVTDFNEPRHMERVTLKGDRPLGPGDVAGGLAA